MKIRWLVISTFAISTMLLVAQTTQKSDKTDDSPSSFVLRYKGKVGDVNRYQSWFVLRMATAFSVPGQGRENRMEYKSDAIYVQKVISVSEDGTLELETTKERGKAQVSADGKSEELPDEPFKEMVKMTDRGRVLEKRVLEGEEEKEEQVDEEFPLASDRYNPNRWFDELFETAFHNIVFPEQAIKVGDTWQEKVTKDMTPNCKVNITIKSRFKKLEKLEGRLCVVIDSLIDGPFEGQDTVGDWTINLKGHFSATVTIYFDPEMGDERQSIDEGRLFLEASMHSPESDNFTMTHKVIGRVRTLLLD